MGWSSDRPTRSASCPRNGIDRSCPRPGPRRSAASPASCSRASCCSDGAGHRRARRGPRPGRARAAATTRSPGATAPTAKGPARNEWALTPTGDNPAEPGSRPNLSYELAPGATVHDSVTVWNYSDQQLAFRIYARDAFNTPSGGFDLLRRDQDSTDAGSWITLEQNSMIVPPHSGIASGSPSPCRPTPAPATTPPASSPPSSRRRTTAATATTRARRAPGRVPRLRAGRRPAQPVARRSTRCTRSTTAACWPRSAAIST